MSLTYVFEDYSNSTESIDHIHPKRISISKITDNAGVKLIHA
ncbi:hypothetical protein [Salipaludibacillus neizhouensis]|nr:hypothetical protein [Salipaludibacillus neizhouensis]